MKKYTKYFFYGVIDSYGIDPEYYVSDGVAARAYQHDSLWADPLTECTLPYNKGFMGMYHYLRERYWEIA